MSTALAEAIATHVRPGDRVHLVQNHHRWSAGAWELMRQHWGGDSGLEVVVASLTSVGALLVRGGMVRRLVAAYTGDNFPAPSPSPLVAEAVRGGRTEVEHWSILSLAQRLEAAARGLPAAVTRSLAGSSMAANPAYHAISTEQLGEVGLLAPLAPDVAILHAPLADREGNVLLGVPSLDGVWAPWAARRGVVATVEAMVDDLGPWRHRPILPAHRVLAAVPTPMGAHPGGLDPADLPVEGYVEDMPFWIAARQAGRGDPEAFAREWCLDRRDHADYLQHLGAPRLDALREAAVAPRVELAEAHDGAAATAAPATAMEIATVAAARELRHRIAALGADVVLAGAGAANLAAWLAVTEARAQGCRVALVAEIGIWGYRPEPGNPTIFNQRNYPTASMLDDCSLVLGLALSGPGTRAIGCVGAGQVDRHGNLNSTLIPGGPFLVGSGGVNDVATTADETMVILPLRPQRTPEEVGYVTAPGHGVRAVVTDRGVLRKRGGVLELAAVTAGPGSVARRVDEARQCCGWDLTVAADVEDLPPPTPRELAILRGFDPAGWYLTDS